MTAFLLRIAVLCITSKASAFVTLGDGRRRGVYGRTYRQELENFADLQYYSKISLGGQTVKTLVDTASSELVVLTRRCKFWCGIGKHFYDPMNSHDYKGGELGVKLEFTSGDLIGNEAYERLMIGQFRASWQPFWEITDGDMPLLFHTNFSGILGLGPIWGHMHLMIPGSRHNEMRYALTLPRLMVWRYSVCLDWRPEHPGYLTWNDNLFDSKKEKFKLISIIESGFWMAPLKNVYLGDIPIACFEGCGAILDVATPMLAMSDSAYELLGNAIMDLDAGCEMLEILPRLTFTLGEQNFSLPPDSYFSEVFGLVNQEVTDHFQINRFTNSHNSTCQPAIMKLSLKSHIGDTWILGAPFFRSYYTTFVQGEIPSIYAAPAGNDCEVDDDDDEKNLHGSKKRRHRHQVMRPIDASLLYMPFWWKKIARYGHVPRDGNLERSVLRHGHLVKDKHKKEQS